MYDFFLHTPVPLARMNAELFGGKAAYWQEIVDHTAYDEFWKKRSLWKFMDGVKCAVLNVGGWFDAEDPVGPAADLRRGRGEEPGHAEHAGDGPVVARRLGARHRANARQPELRASRPAEFFRENIQFPFFMQYLKDKPAKLPEAWMFLTGINECRRLDAWPPKDLQPTTLYFDADGKLSRTRPAGARRVRRVRQRSEPAGAVRRLHRAAG